PRSPLLVQQVGQGDRPRRNASLEPIPLVSHRRRAAVHCHRHTVIPTREPSPALLPLPTLVPPVLASPPDRRLWWPILGGKSPVNGTSADILPPNKENRSFTWGRTFTEKMRGRSDTAVRGRQPAKVNAVRSGAWRGQTQGAFRRACLAVAVRRQTTEAL
ncbi:unnamed protein product, partial [Ectocarpus sp. 6 AP-2014]